MSSGGPPQKALLSILPKSGEVTLSCFQQARLNKVIEVSEVEATTDVGLVGDRYASKSKRDRQVTLIQSEHLAAAGSMLHRDPLDPAIVRRNIVVAGVNLLALKNQRFKVGDAILQFTGLCHPCSRMEEVLGPGGYNAMRGHGGITAEVLEAGTIKIGDAVCLFRKAHDSIQP